MLMLLFYLGKDSYAIESSSVVEVIPRVPLRKINHVPDYVAGLFNYRGKIAPVIDLCHLIQGKPSGVKLSTRIIMVNSMTEDRTMPYLGLMAERIIKTLDKPDSDLVNSDVHMNVAPYLGGIILDQNGMIQRIHLDRLFTDARQFYLAAAGEVKTDEPREY
ncbi:chemotaxis protein CheW [Roseofilum sp. BLCC_M154]|jgi:chemotaxis-related protein WspB|uniref:Chemotaxis protein CheW n=1 Tax=Roseofilum acuticapitatum BLCC-M154 TaxID=3022444 RepID=A0ABT7AXN8_9CYAN|nr:chemotaxis protein CheW [Roseofilum acuticapitatum]MDJ1171676.1 chemotaxis protein CheW [Roseofilum acuticapitatum BLCC-M154]